jgi:hypothetical protein
VAEVQRRLDEAQLLEHHAAGDQRGEGARDQQQRAPHHRTSAESRAQNRHMAPRRRVWKLPSLLSSKSYPAVHVVCESVTYRTAA